jgi:AraC family transcriptional regulator, transcriptional activator of pobA
MAYSYSDIFQRLSVAFDEQPTCTLSDASTRLRIHRHTAANAIRSTTGDSFRAWRDRRLFDSAARSLRAHRDLTIKEISAQLGFNSTRAFDRFIKRHSGLCPTEIRRSAA